MYNKRFHLFALVGLALLIVTSPAMAQWVDDGAVVRLSTASDSVGVGTPNPEAKLHLFQPSGYGLAVGSQVSSGITLRFSGNAMAAFTNGSPSTFVINPEGGNLSVGHPAAVANTKLHVFGTSGYLLTVGNVASGNQIRMSNNAIGSYLNNAATALVFQPDGGATSFGGDVSVTGNIAAKYQDVAEWVDATSPLAPGTVVVLNTNEINEVMASSRAYDSTVAGVVSAQPGVLLGEKADGREKIATTGRVKVRVDASAGAIRVGDLLVTSNVKGTAMKSQPIEVGGTQIHRPGTIIGKALEPLASGVGEILVLLSMQ